MSESAYFSHSVPYFGGRTAQKGCGRDGLFAQMTWNSPPGGTAGIAQGGEGSVDVVDGGDAVDSGGRELVVVDVAVVAGVRSGTREVGDD